MLASIDSRMVYGVWCIMTPAQLSTTFGEKQHAVVWLQVKGYMIDGEVDYITGRRYRCCERRSPCTNRPSGPLASGGCPGPVTHRCQM
jgi:hypothetical protein